MIEFHAALLDILRLGRAVKFRAGGDSMHPTIRDGDSVTAVAATAQELRRGDVAVTLSARGVTVHRVVHVDGERVITRGDNAAENDAPFPASEVIGRVIEIERQGKRQRVGGLWRVRLRKLFLR